MAETFTKEGLDRLLNFVPRDTGTALDATLYMAAITTAGFQIRSPSDVPLDGTHVPDPSTVWSTDYSTVASSTARGAGGEPAISTGSYARVSMANSVWGAISAQASGRRTTASQQSFPASTAAWSNQNVCGYGIVTAATAGSGVAYCYANFDDNSIVAINASGITLQVTPYWEFDY